MSVETFINRLLVLFGPPETMDDDAFIDELRDMFGRRSDRVLKDAGDKLRSEHTRRGWPTIGEINEAVRAAAAYEDLIKRHQARPEQIVGPPPPTPEECARVQAMVDELKRAAAAWRLPPADDAPLRDVSRPAFEEMQRNSPNKDIHRRPATLTERSRRMQGDDA